MTKISGRYLSGMRAFNAFHDLLYDCLKESLPQATLSKSGAFRWRGYRIDAYETLARGQYYFLVYPGDPKHLILEEAYFDTKGKYHRPFVLRLNLQESQFFLLDLDEQRAFLSKFIVQAARQALIWQESEGRKTLVAPDDLEGHKVQPNARSKPAELWQITCDYVISTPLQTKLLEMLRDAVSVAAESLSTRFPDGVYLEPNDHWRNWEYRGYRMQARAADGSVPKGSFPYRWNIYYDKPALICLESYDGKRSKRINSIDLQRAGFFDLEEIEQQKMLESFVLQALG